MSTSGRRVRRNRRLSERFLSGNVRRRSYATVAAPTTLSVDCDMINSAVLMVSECDGCARSLIYTRTPRETRRIQDNSQDRLEEEPFFSSKGEETAEFVILRYVFAFLDVLFEPK